MAYFRQVSQSNGMAALSGVVQAICSTETSPAPHHDTTFHRSTFCEVSIIDIDEHRALPRRFVKPSRVVLIRESLDPCTAARTRLRIKVI